MDMASREERLGNLRLFVIRDRNDITIGFNGYPQHTHGDVTTSDLEFLGKPACTLKPVAERLVDEVLSGKCAIGTVNRGGEIKGPCRPADEVLELLWDGAPWVAS